jgi:hypothetical protein
MTVACGSFHNGFASQLFKWRARRQATIDETIFTQFVMNGADWALQIRRNPIR